MDFQSSPMSVKATMSIGKGLAANTSLKHFGIEDDPYFNFEMAEFIAEGLAHNKFIRSAYLRGTSMGDSGFLDVLDAVIRNDSLKVIYCDQDHITDVGAYALAEKIKNREIAADTRFSLTGNSITDRGVDSLLRAVEVNPTLAGISLSLDNPLKTKKNANKIDAILNDEHVNIMKSIKAGYADHVMKKLKNMTKHFSWPDAASPNDNNLNDLINALEKLKPSVEDNANKKCIDSIINIANANKQRLLCGLNLNAITMRAVFARIAGPEKNQVAAALEKGRISVETPFFSNNELHRLSEDSSPSILLDAFVNYANEKDYRLNNDAKTALLQVLTKVCTHSKPEGFRYGKFIKAIFDLVIEKQSMRVVSQGIKDKEGLMEVTRFDLNVL